MKDIRPPLLVDTMVPNRAQSYRRPRSGSIVKVEEVGAGSDSEMLDQSAYPNVNVEWVNQKGMCSFSV
jgi:hypothetical protein